MIKIIKTNSNFEREKLSAPFGFKGGYIDELWQIAAYMESQKGAKAVGLGIQSILWSDAAVFTNYSSPGGNAAMYLMTEFALKKAKEIDFESPMELLDYLLPLTYDYGRKITGNSDLRTTFALNALVAVDNAAWILYCREKGITSFDEMIPDDVRPALSYKQDKLAAIPLMTYGTPISKIKEAVDEGSFFLKIKIGSDPEKDGDLDKMLRWDMERLQSIHELVKELPTPHTVDGHIPYYLDANGRYDNKERLLRLLDFADSKGILERILLLEEPFPEELDIDVRDIPVRLVADESAHSDKDARERIEQGYGAIALKPIAKTMSMSFKILKVANEMDIPCFCADLTVNPVMVDWNKNVAARIRPLPGMNVGVVETNGHQNYKNWTKMQSYHPCSGANWMRTENGLFVLDRDFYKQSGGIFKDSSHYNSLI